MNSFLKTITVLFRIYFPRWKCYFPFSEIACAYCYARVASLHLINYNLALTPAVPQTILWMRFAIVPTSSGLCLSAGLEHSCMWGCHRLRTPSASVNIPQEWMLQQNPLRTFKEWYLSACTLSSWVWPFPITIVKCTHGHINPAEKGNSNYDNKSRKYFHWIELGGRLKRIIET